MTDYRIAECLNKQTLKPYYTIQRYNNVFNEYHLCLDKHIETLEEAKEAVKMLRKYKHPIYHYVDEE